MTTHKEHSKHAHLTKPGFGVFSRNEIALIGTNCDQIRYWAGLILESFGQQFRIAYVDTDHRAYDSDLQTELLQKGAIAEFSDKMNYWEYGQTGTLNDFDKKLLFGSMDLVLVNGNHHRASAQIVIEDPAKAASLAKRAEQLSNVIAVIGDQAALPENILDNGLIPDGTPQFPKTDNKVFLEWIGKRLNNRQAPLKGLVLAGGKSIRMGFDKGGIVYSEKDQRNRTADLIAPFCEEVYISCRRKQLDEIESSYPLLADSYLGLGPYGAILSAFRHDPDAAWLVVACDLPFLHTAAIDELVKARATNTYATAYHNPQTDFPDPLCTVWEPRAYRRMLDLLSLGFCCPRKVLLNSDIKLVKPADPEVLTNVNTPEELERIKNRMKTKVQ